MHPHNYYLEILTEIGLIGFLITLIMFLSIFYSFFMKKAYTTSNIYTKKISIPFLILFFVEIFPIKSTGSFFTTGNTTYLFLIISILVALSKNDNSFEKKLH